MTRDQKYDALLLDFAKAEEKVSSLSSTLERPSEYERNDLIGQLSAQELKCEQLQQENFDLRNSLSKNGPTVLSEKLVKLEGIVKSLEAQLRKCEVELETEKLRSQKKDLQNKLRNFNNKDSPNRSEAQTFDNGDEISESNVENEYAILRRAVEEMADLENQREQAIQLNTQALEDALAQQDLLRRENEELKSENRALKILNDIQNGAGGTGDSEHDGGLSTLESLASSIF